MTAYDDSGTEMFLHIQLAKVQAARGNTSSSRRLVLQTLMPCLEEGFIHFLQCTHCIANYSVLFFTNGCFLSISWKQKYVCPFNSLPSKLDCCFGMSRIKASTFPNRSMMRNGLRRSRLRSFDGTTHSGWKWWRVGRWMRMSSICMGMTVLSRISMRGTFWNGLIFTTMQVRLIQVTTHFPPLPGFFVFTSSFLGLLANIKSVVFIL